MTAKKKSAPRQSSRRSSNTSTAAHIAVENVNHPGKSRSVDAANYQAMRRAMMKILPASSPGFTAAEMSHAVLAHLPAKLFPDGAKAGWWLKTVQLDLEAKKVIAREKTTPLRWHRS